MNFSFRLVFSNVAQRKIRYSMNFSFRLNFTNCTEIISRVLRLILLQIEICNAVILIVHPIQEKTIFPYSYHSFIKSCGFMGSLFALKRVGSPSLSHVERHLRVKFLFQGVWEGGAVEGGQTQHARICNFHFGKHSDLLREPTLKF